MEREGWDVGGGAWGVATSFVCLGGGECERVFFFIT
jgi:hypothetical protein